MVPNGTYASADASHNARRLPCRSCPQSPGASTQYDGSLAHHRLGILGGLLDGLRGADGTSPRKLRDRLPARRHTLGVASRL